MDLIQTICNYLASVAMSLQLGACLCLWACLPPCQKQPLTQKQLPLQLENN